MNSSRSPFAVLLPVILFFAVSLLAEDSKSLTFPVGKADVGKSLFVKHGCHQCHSAGATKLPKVDLEPRLVIELGDRAHEKWTRDDFAQAVMAPDHLVAEEYRIAMMRLGDNLKAENSPMPKFSDLLLVSELIDLVSFLDELTDSPALP